PPRREQALIVTQLERRFNLLRSVEHAIQAARTRLHEYERFVVQAATEGTLAQTQTNLDPDAESSFDTAAELLARLRREKASEVRRKGSRKLGATTNLFAAGD